MSGKARPKVHGRPAGAGASYSGEFLRRIARILVHAGHSPKALSREFREICARLPEPARRWDPKQLAYFADLGHVIAHWHADPQCLDSRGAPIPLPLRARRGPSLWALIKRVLPAEDPAAVAESLLGTRGIRRTRGLYVPTGRYLTYSGVIGETHGLTALRGMLRTVEHNTSGSKRAALLERVAMNPSFPVSALSAFHRRVKTRATDLLWNFDGDMRRQERSDVRGPRVRLGIGIFVFEEPIVENRGPRTPRTRAVAVPARRKRRAT